jgi:hypothetical protein
MGLSQAVVSEITFKNGKSEQDNFHQYEIVRMSMAPKKIVVHFIPSDSVRRAARRRRRAGGAGDRAGADERDLRRDREADPPAAAEGPALVAGLSGRIRQQPRRQARRGCAAQPFFGLAAASARTAGW